jgi:hypothetical protein
VDTQGHAEKIVYSLIHATQCPEAYSFRPGISTLHSSVGIGHRVLKTQPSEAELLTLIDQVISERLKDFQGEPGTQGERGEAGTTGLQGASGPQGEPGTKVVLRESRLGNNLSFDTATQGQTWLSGLTLTIELASASTVQVIADADVEFPGGGYTFLVGIATSASAPSETQEHGANTNAVIKITSKRLFSLSAGTHTFHFMAFNQTGAPSFKNLVMTALAVED